MLAAFTAQPIVELKQRDKSKIESILSHSDQLLVGLNTGSLRIYRVRNPPSRSSEDGNINDDTSATVDASNSTSKPTELLREYEKFSKYKIEQLAVFREANILISLSNGLVSIHDLGTYELQEQLTNTKGATVFAATSNIVKDSTTGVPTLVSRLAVGVKRRLLLWSWHDGELNGDAVEIALSHSIKSLTWASGTKILAGLSTHYVLVHPDSQDVKTIVGPGSIGGAPGQESSRLGGTMSYIGMGGMVPAPLATGLGENEMLLARDINTHFIDRDGEPMNRRQIPWRSPPQVIGYSYPHLLALQEASKGSLEVRNPKTLTLLQSIDLPGAVLLQVPNPNISLAHQGKGFLVASERIVWRMQGLNYDAQIDSLVEGGYLDEAISLLEMIEETLIKDKVGRLREIKMQKAQKLFDEKKFRDALDLFGEVSAPPERVIRLYPAVIAGDLAIDAESPSPEAPASSPEEHAAKPKHKKAEVIASPVQKVKTAATDADAESVRSVKTSDLTTGDAEGLSEKEIKTAVRELQAFLADVRRRLQRFFNPDQTVRSLSEVQSGAQVEDIRQFTEHLLGVSTLEDVDLGEKLPAVARLVDTTLFRAHMYATPSLAGSLFRISNFCDPDVVMAKLEESERYNDLIEFLYGKRLHRQALERLQKFGKAEHTEDVDPQLHGAARTVSYLQNLGPDSIDMILEFARWPLEAAPEMAIEIFLADTENAESLPRHKVLDFLESIDKNLAQRYLEHVVDELDDQTPDLHQRLVTLYLERLKAEAGSDQQETLDKLVTLLKASEQYSPAKTLGLLPRDEPLFYEPRAIVFSRMGNHRQALEVYVFKLHDPARAEEYCNQTHLEETINDTSKPSSRRKSTTDPVDEQPSIYHILLNLYLHPPKGEKALWGPAIELMTRHGPRLPASSTLELIPEDLLVKELEFYFRGRIRNANTVMNDSMMSAGLRKVEAVRVQAALLLGEGVQTGGRGRKVRIDEDRVCGVCYKRLGGSVISVFPDSSVVHLGCAARKQTESAGKSQHH
ncbi:Vacuolar morphogenesis protein 6 [Exophiala xenobiotica]